MFQSYRRRVDMVRASAAHDAQTYQAFVDTAAKLGCNTHESRILDVGCGANAPMTIMLHSSGARVTGIDWKIGHRWGLGWRLDRYVSYRKEAGLPKTLRKALGEIVYDRHYYDALAEAIGFPLTEENLDLRKMNAESITLPDSTFDLVHSNATWEHLPDVRAVNREVARVLRPGGIACVEMHLFPSISGGHDLPWIVPGRLDLGTVTPWGHLRNPRWRAPVHLNRLREREFYAAFKETDGLEIVEWQLEHAEGEALVTDEILQELSTYTREELTRRSVIAVVRRVR